MDREIVPFGFRKVQWKIEVNNRPKNNTLWKINQVFTTLKWLGKWYGNYMGKQKEWIINNMGTKKLYKHEVLRFHFKALSRLWIGEGRGCRALVPSLLVQIHRKLGNAFVLLYLSLTRALLLSSCRLRTRSPWLSLWHATSTRGQFVLHDLQFV